jgi:hypothetical protein
MWVLPQALEIIFEVQRKKSNAKNIKEKKKKNFNLQNTCFCFLDLFYFQTS